MLINLSARFFQNRQKKFAEFFFAFSKTWLPDSWFRYTYNMILMIGQVDPIETRLISKLKVNALQNMHRKNTEISDPWDIC